MRVAVVAGPDPGHAFPAVALCLRLLAAGDEPVLFTGPRWFEPARAAGIAVRRLKGLAPRPDDDDRDAGRRIHQRAAYIAAEILPDLSAMLPELVVSDVLTVGGGLAAERLGVPWLELSPHPLYLPSKALPPIGSGLEPGQGLRGRARDAVLRGLTARAIHRGERQRSAARASIGLPEADPGPDARLVATLPALEVPRPDWPENAHLIGPLLWEPTADTLPLPPGGEPLVMVAPSTAHTGVTGMAEAVLEALDGAGLRVALSMLDTPPAALPPWATAGLGRQDELLRHAAVVVGGGGHGLLAKTLLAGVPIVTVPGGGDQWELANRAARQGSSILIRPFDPTAVRDAVHRVLADPAYRAAAARAAATADAVADPVEICHRVRDTAGAR
ncbi:glycosyl transferase [Nocardia terpenica]|uniref:glycosyltransferase n=1 Tax=Nocardia terpenica TaxID=455432 RepID=UPI001895FDA1|nr:nucleotide disphospho-sugar-binding domain-containing protein [Nocardia terpenica]MBF6065220.1 glycosyl transferase [Nocardia terpenica]MBF6107947.1 glycosyl transferase [Nocardia terpenica]MBF6115522.1 glycosyl transferase [Nocardia terpenica]MBF6121959.1 glycosyl transferase [Nocardia terpenica]MBF6155497.1 glycosyl transferase [Nocardia terpenica]